MKQYQKWLNEHFRPICLSQQSKDKMSLTWKAALEWVLQVKKQGDKLASFNDDILMAIENAIKKELEDETKKD